MDERISVMTGFLDGREMTRAEYEQWITESRRRAARERIWRRLLIGGLVVLGLAAVFGFMVAVSHGATPLGSGVETYPRAPSLESKKKMTLAEGEAECKRSGGEWFVDETSEGLPPGSKIIGCMWLVPKGLK